MKNILKIGVILGVCFSSGIALSNYGYYRGCDTCAPKIFVPVGASPSLCGGATRVCNDCFTQVSNMAARVWIQPYTDCNGVFVPGHWRGRPFGGFYNRGFY